MKSFSFFWLVVTNCLLLLSMLFLTSAMGCTCAAGETPSPSDEVNMLVGSGGGGTEYGGTMPFVKTPFGMTDWVAQTRQNKVSTMSYAYESESQRGQNRRYNKSAQ